MNQEHTLQPFVAGEAHTLWRWDSVTFVAQKSAKDLKSLKMNIF